MTTPRLYELRYPFTGEGCDLAAFVVLERAAEWLETAGRRPHQVNAYTNIAAAIGDTFDVLEAEAVIVLSDPDTATLLKLSLITD